MINTICLDKNYSTTKLVVQDKPEIIKNADDKFEIVLFLPEGEERKGEGGLRTKGYFKKSYEDKPLISIVTVVYNGEKYFEETIQSVINQTYDNVEYIIIDGGSTDGTLDIIKKYEDRVDYWVSERDSGIYDAMNKGIDLASGDWINFMNGGDLFSSYQIIKKIFRNKHYSIYKIIFGDTVIDYKLFKKIFKADSNLKHLWKGMCFTHQSTFINSTFHKNNKFKSNIKIGADFEFFYSSYIKGVQFKYLNQVISIMEIGGISYVDRVSSIKDHYKVVKKYNNSLYVRLYYIYLISLNKFKFFIKKFLPKNFIKFIQKNI